MDEHEAREAVRRILSRSHWDGDCLVWEGSTSQGGYPRMTFLKRDEYAHRLMFRAVHGPVPEGKTVDHECHLTLCVNPDHLRAATPSEQQCNRSGAARNNKLGIRGVRRAPEGGGYRLPFIASVRAGGVNHRRYFATVEEAAEGVEQMRRELLPPDFVGKG